ncbi:MAG: M20/M25/M40 family metallo-hydrolase [Bdellovibrionales bacterium]|nr:M20/M25/M40 family metallo-hydrolase [Bdellovibrionales bacterium]
MDFVEACKALIAIDSTPSNGTGEACRFLKKLSEEMGFQVVLEEEVIKGTLESNILCFVDKQQTEVHLMLQTHLDTVAPESFSLWEKTGRNPFQATIHQGKIYGLGAADTKLDFLCKLYAAKEFIGRKPLHPFAVVGTFGEEYRMDGAIRLIRHKSLKPQRALVGEPTGLDLVYAGKGLANIEISLPFSKEEMEGRLQHDTGESQSAQGKVFRGRAAHSALPHMGENAILKLVEYLNQLPEKLLLLEIDGGTNYNTVPIQSILEFDLIPLKETTLNQKLLKIFDKIKDLQKQFTKIKDPEFDPDVTTFNVGMARTYSDHVKLMGCVRWPAGVQESDYMIWMDELRQTCENIGGLFQVRDYKKPFRNDPGSQFATRCLEQIKKHNPQSAMATQPVTNEANVFSKLSIETLVWGPGKRDANSQTTEECVDIEDLHLATKIYQNIIEELCY